MADLSSRSKGDLLALLKMSGELIKAMDGLWFRVVQEAHGQEDAVKLSDEVRERYTLMLVKRSRKRFGRSGSDIERMVQVLETDPSFVINDYEISHLSQDRLFLRVNRCATLEAMERSGRKELVCDGANGSCFRNIAKEIGASLAMHAIRLPPRNSRQEACCEWLFEARADVPIDSLAEDLQENRPSGRGTTALLGRGTTTRKPVGERTGQSGHGCRTSPIPGSARVVEFGNSKSKRSK
jgi:hypothetical protein